MPELHRTRNSEPCRRHGRREPLSAEPVEPTDVVIEDCVIVTKRTLRFGRAITGSISYCEICTLPYGYTPPLLRRPRLARLRPLWERQRVARNLWVWMKRPPLETT